MVHTVYPRVCGGTSPMADDVRRVKGLSPRVRGNLLGDHRRFRFPGSIPACAGEPRRAARMSSMSEVYPRVCGGTQSNFARVRTNRGLSPRVRGNRLIKGLRRNATGSIPACAGEPPPLPRDLGQTRVYPRVCGGTGQLSVSGYGAQGLSPRVRGNRPQYALPDQSARSIPACAGEPYGPPRVCVGRWVYPRVCGGTDHTLRSRLIALGLSPRVRGNRCAGRGIDLGGGSIPACAGEPRGAMRVLPAAKVYPRVCGGTPAGLTRWRRYAGLSPRVRGNREPLIDKIACLRSIPACAGEPI